MIPAGRWLVLALFLPGFCTGCGRKKVAPAMMRGAIRAVLDQQAKDWNAGDLEGFMRVYWRSPQLSFNSNGVLKRGWAATMERYRQRYPDREAMGYLKFDVLEIRELGDDAAYVLGRWYLRKTEPVGGTFTLVLRKIDGAWRIVHDHTSVDPPPQ
ncbi:MAG: YybH family protein [Phycisphaerae bacterium]